MRASFLLALILMQSVARGVEFDLFLQVSPGSASVITGGSPDPIYSGWSSVIGFEAGTAKDVAGFQGGPTSGAGAFKSLTLVKRVDAATTFFTGNLTAGAPLATVRMVVVQRGPARIELWDMTATTCYFSAQEFTFDAGDELMERITIDAGKFEWSYVTTAPSGDALTEFFANWSILTETGTSGTRPPVSAGDQDSDADGIPDGWEAFYGLNKNLADAGLDTDGDGLTNLQERVAHTDPTKSQSVLRVSAFQAAGAGNYTLTWQSVAGLNYRILTATTPAGPYMFLKNVSSAGNGSTSTTVSGPAGRFFYRVATP